MTITIRLPRPARRSVAIFVAGLLLGIPATVLASHQFPDVPSGHPFHTEIGAIAEAGITAGFADGGYHPGEPVTRQAMAAFMHRGFGRVGLAIGDPPMTASVSVAAEATFSYHEPVRQLTITVPGASGAFSPTQLVHLQGRVQFNTAMDAAKGCPCEFRALIRDMTTFEISIQQYQTFESFSSESLFRTFDVEALFSAPPGPRTYWLEVALSDRVSTTNAASFSLSSFSSLSATTFPFGPAGSDALSSAGAQNVAADVDQLSERRRDE